MYRGVYRMCSRVLSLEQALLDACFDNKCVLCLALGSRSGDLSRLHKLLLRSFVSSYPNPQVLYLMQFEQG